jgi:signal recognition particle receptor subunit beta
MPSYDERTRCLRCKVVFWGPAHGGKTTALRAIHGAIPADRRSPLACLDTDTRRTLFFDHTTVYLRQVEGGGPGVILDAYTVPGQVFYREARHRVLQQADGVAVVLDSSPDRQAANVESLASLREILGTWGVDLDELPLAVLYNKRDLADAVPVEEMRKRLNPGNRPDFAAVASRGEGVMEVLNALCDELLERHLFRGTRRPLEGHRLALPGFGR